MILSILKFKYNDSIYLIFMQNNNLNTIYVFFGELRFALALALVNVVVWCLSHNASLLIDGCRSNFRTKVKKYKRRLALYPSHPLNSTKIFTQIIINSISYFISYFNYSLPLLLLFIIFTSLLMTIIDKKRPLLKNLK